MAYAQLPHSLLLKLLWANITSWYYISFTGSPTEHSEAIKTPALPLCPLSVSLKYSQKIPTATVCLHGHNYHLRHLKFLWTLCPYHVLSDSQDNLFIGSLKWLTQQVFLTFKNKEAFVHSLSNSFLYLGKGCGYLTHMQQNRACGTRARSFPKLKSISP